MASPRQLATAFSGVFFKDIVEIYPLSARKYRCTDISDIHYCELGVLRCLSSAVTGHEFLQHHADQNVATIDPSHFFKSLKSPRRLANITSLNDLLAQPMNRLIADPFAQCEQLDDWDSIPSMGTITRRRVSIRRPKMPPAHPNPRPPGTFSA